MDCDRCDSTVDSMFDTNLVVMSSNTHKGGDFYIDLCSPTYNAYTPYPTMQMFWEGKMSGVITSYIT